MFYITAESEHICDQCFCRKTSTFAVQVTQSIFVPCANNLKATVVVWQCRENISTFCIMQYNRPDYRQFTDVPALQKPAEAPAQIAQAGANVY